MNFMVTFPLAHRGYQERVSRFLETGDPKALFRWVSEWADIIDFEIEPVLRDDEAGPIWKELM